MIEFDCIDALTSVTQKNVSTKRSNPSPNVSQSVNQLSEEEQIMIAHKIGLIQHLPTGKYDGKKNTECVICMEEFVFDDCVRYLPCLHTKL